MAGLSVMSRFRFRLSATIVNFLVAAFLVAFCNNAFWKSFMTRLGSHSWSHGMFLALAALALIMIFNLILSLFSFRPVHKPVLVVVLLVAASVSYFMKNYGVIIDKHMICNVIETDVREASELLTWALVKHLVLLGFLPSALLMMTRITYRPFRRELPVRVCVILASAALLALILVGDFREFALFGRENKDLRMFINPTYSLYSVTQALAQKNVAHADEPVAPLALDATRTRGGGKTVVVLVVGETARAQEFNLNGYGRNTNPELGKLDIYNFSEVQSCGTETAVSVPCMFSPFGKDGYSRKKADHSENLLDVLQRTGVHVVWRDNNSGSKGVSKRVTFEDLSREKDSQFCSGDECYDEILLKNLKEQIEKNGDDQLIVLHQKGSHGPSYYKRTPRQFKIFTPECTMDNIQDCDPQSIINAYDNTILYTDHVLAEVIELLNKENIATAMLYVSDHGESLGENNLYLHGLPYTIAPTQQTHVPMVFWASDSFVKNNDLDPALLAKSQNEQWSHDNLFHTMLGIFKVKTQVYRPDMDILAHAHLHRG